MKITSLLFALIFFYCGFKNASAQDLIILKNKDSINCKVVEEINQNVIYLIKENSIYVKRAVPKYLVESIEKKYFINTALDPEIELKYNQTLTPVQQDKKYKQFNLIFGTNYTRYYKIFNESKNDTVRKYHNKLENSYSVEVELRQWLSKKVGIGLNGSYYNSFAEQDRVLMYDGWRYSYIDISDRFIVFNISPTFYLRNEIVPDKYYFNFFVAPEFNSFKNLFSVSSTTGELLGKSYGFNIGASFEYKLPKGMLAGFKCRYGTSSIRKAEFNINGTSNEIELEGNNRIDLTRINIGFYFGLY